MLNINIVCIGKIKEKYLQDAIAEYSKRLSNYCNFKIVELPDEKLPSKTYDSLLMEVKKKETHWSKQGGKTRRSDSTATEIMS